MTLSVTTLMLFGCVVMVHFSVNPVPLLVPAAKSMWVHGVGVEYAARRSC